MNVLITGSGGFIGKNLIEKLQNIDEINLFEHTRETPDTTLDIFCQECDFVFHLAGVQRPEDPMEFMVGNYESTLKIVDRLKKFGNFVPIMYASSIQANQDNLYGESKRASEKLLFDYEEKHKQPVYIFRFSNIFGKWGKPNFNSAVTTFCYNVSRNMPIIVNDPSTKMRLLYIDDVVHSLVETMYGIAKKNNNFCMVEPVYEVKLGNVVSLLGDLKEYSKDVESNIYKDEFARKLFDTYNSYLPK